MTGTAHRVRAARGRLVRLVAMLAVLAGIGLAVGLQCADGRAMPMAHGGSSAVDCHAPMMMGASHERVVPVGGPTPVCPVSTVEAAGYGVGDPSGPGGLGGALASCLAFLVAVGVAAAALRAAEPFRVAVMLRSVRVVVTRVIVPRAPSLAELCLLRT